MRRTKRRAPHGHLALMFSFFVYAFAMPITSNLSRVPIDPRMVLGRALQGITLRGLRKAGSHWVTWEQGSYEKGTLLSMQFWADANGMVTFGMVTDAEFQPQNFDEIVQLAAPFLRKHRLWNAKIKLNPLKASGRVRIEGMSRVSPNIPVDLSSGAGGISLTLGKP